EGHDEDEREDDGQRRITARPVDARTLGAPEGAERCQHHADGERERVLRHATERAADDDTGDDDEDHGGDRAGDREWNAPLCAAEGEDDEGALEPLEQTALERDGEPVPADAGAPLALGREPRRGLALVDRVLVADGTPAARAQDRLAQPLEPEDEQQRADYEPQDLDRDDGERRPEGGDYHREDERGRDRAGERRAPNAR